MVPDPIRQEKLRRLLEAALELPPDQRRAFLQEGSSDDPSLQEEVEALLGPAEMKGPPTAATLGVEDSPQTLPPPREAGRTERRRWGHLEILRKVGEGHFGEVYLCRDASLDRVVALKLFHAETGDDDEIHARVLARIEREGRLLARVKHPNVLNVHGVGAHDGTVGMWTEFVQGKTLSELLRLQGRFGAREASLVGAELCGALAAVHAQGVLHRDIKAQNAIREEGGRIILMDFGAGHDLVEPFGPAEASGVGTPVYMAPEVLAGEPSTVQSDIYSLGVLLFHLVTGSYPVRAETIAEIKEKHRRGEKTSLRDLRPGLPARFIRVVETALRNATDERFASAGQMQHALEAASELVERGGSYAGPPRTDPSIAIPLHRTAAVLTWLGRGAVLAALLTFLGFATSVVYRISLGIPPEFAGEGLPDYLLLGVRALIPGIAVGMLTLVTLASLWWGGAALTRKLRGESRGLALLSRWQAATDLLRRTPPARQLSVLAGLSLAGLAATIAVNWRLLSAIVALPSPSSAAAADLSVLASDASTEQHRFTIHMTVLIVVVLLVLARVLSGSHRPLDVAARTAAAAVIAITVVATSMLVLPWRLLWDDSPEVAMCTQADGTLRKAFVVAESTRPGAACRMWLYYADNHERQSVPCETEDPARSCRRTGRFEYLFGGSFDR